MFNLFAGIWYLTTTTLLDTFIDQVDQCEVPDLVHALRQVAREDVPDALKQGFDDMMTHVPDGIFFTVTRLAPKPVLLARWRNAPRAYKFNLELIWPLLAPHLPGEFNQRILGRFHDPNEWKGDFPSSVS